MEKEYGASVAEKACGADFRKQEVKRCYCCRCWKGTGYYPPAQGALSDDAVWRLTSSRTSGRRVRPAGWMARIGWSGPVRPAWLKAAAARFRCRPGRGHIVAVARLQLVSFKVVICHHLADLLEHHNSQGPRARRILGYFQFQDTVCPLVHVFSVSLHHEFEIPCRRSASANLGHFLV